MVEETESVLYRVNCTLEKDEIQGVIDCHSLVAKAALEYWKGQPGTYIDMEDNCKPTQRANFGYILEASARLKSRRRSLDSGSCCSRAIVRKIDSTSNRFRRAMPNN